MTNQQLYLAIGLPTLTSLITLTLVCLAWLSSRGSYKELRTEIERLESRMDKRFEAIERRFDAVDRRFDAIDAELRYFHGTIGNHDARLTLLEKK